MVLETVKHTGKWVASGINRCGVFVFREVVSSTKPAVVVARGCVNFEAVELSLRAVEK